MNQNITELFALYTNSLNQQTAALQQGFAQMMQLQNTEAVVMPQPETQQANGQQLVQQPKMEQPIIRPAEPAQDIEVESPAFIAPDKTYTMVLMIKKPCSACPFASACKAKPSHILPECNVDSMKQAAIEGGEIHMKVAVENMKFTFKAYKNGQYIGDLALNRETNDLRAELEKYIGQTVILSTHLVKANENSTFTKLFAEILGTVQEEVVADTQVETAKMPTSPEPIFSATSNALFNTSAEPNEPEESTLNLGDMILPF